MQGTLSRRYWSGVRAISARGSRPAPHNPPDGFLFLDAWWMLFCFVLMCESIPTVAILRLVSLTAGIGLALLATRITQKSALRLALFVALNMSILLSVMAGHRLEMVLFAFVRVFVISPYVFLYLTYRGLRRSTVAALALGVIPQVVTYLTGNTFSDSPAYTFAHQFNGIAGDPNYLSTYLVVALGAQLALIRCSQRKSLLVVLSVAAVTTVFLVTISLSRAGTAAACLSLVIFGLSYRTRHPYLQFATIVVTMYVCFTVLQHAGGMMSGNATLGTLYERFTVEGKSSILGNERYDVWKSALEQAVAKGPIDYADENMFLTTEGTVVHNVLLRLALIYGWLAGLVHSVIWGVGLTVLSVSFFRQAISRTRQQTAAIGAPSSVLLIIFPYFLVIMTIPALEQNLYWYTFGMVFALGLFKRSMGQCSPARSARLVEAIPACRAQSVTKAEPAARSISLGTGVC